MNSFHTVAIPHKDILAGRLTMDVYAADLWDVYKKRGTEEYYDADLFFEKTYVTQGLENILDIVGKRLKGEGGDPVIQLQTPFGGGKTHALIAIYHKAPEWQAITSVIVGTALDPHQTLWGLMEQQLTGKMSSFSGSAAPGKEALRKLLVDDTGNRPILILMDEILQYVTRAAAVKIEQSNLAAQTIAFMHELAELVATLDHVVLVVTLPSSITEHYDEAAETLYQKLQKVTGRVEKIYTPVQDSEITHIVRRRLFSSFDQEKAAQTVNLFTAYAEKEGILPENTQVSDYRQRFLDAYPFLPEVIDVLYHRWGSFPGFQRTRGVLRILSLLIYHSRKTDKPYISLADFDLSGQEMRQELLKHTGQEFNSIIDMDIAGTAANAGKIDDSLGDSYRGLNLGRRTAAAIFLYSFSGGQEQGVDLRTLKRTATTTQNPAAVISEVIDELEKKLFYIQGSGGRYYFSSQANLNRILSNRVSNISDEAAAKLELELLEKNIGGSPFKIYLRPRDTAQIPDTEDLKLIILESEDKPYMQEIYSQKGQSPRVYRNTLFFLYPLSSEKLTLWGNIRKQAAYRQIEADPHLRLSDEQRETVKDRVKKLDQECHGGIHRSYRMIVYPGRGGDFKQLDLGVPAFGRTVPLDTDVYNLLREESEILENISPIVIREKYLPGKDYVLTDQLYHSSLKTPGETRFVKRDALEKAIMEGVSKGMFGLGELEGNRPVYRYFEEECFAAFSGNEIIISETICRQQIKKKNEERQSTTPGEIKPMPGAVQVPVVETPQPRHLPQPSGAIEPVTPGEIVTATNKRKDEVRLRFRLPRGKASDLMGVLHYLQQKFGRLDIELSAHEGSITIQEYEDKVREAFSQMGVELEE